MRPSKPLLLAVSAVTALLVACGDGGVDTAQPTQQATESAQNAFDSLRTDAERFVDELQTRQAPEARQQLLDRCRDALERLRKANSDTAGQVDKLCDRIRDTKLTDAGSWQDIRQQLEKLNVR